MSGIWRLKYVYRSGRSPDCVFGEGLKILLPVDSQATTPQQEIRISNFIGGKFNCNFINAPEDHFYASSAFNAVLKRPARRHSLIPGLLGLANSSPPE